MSEKSSDLSIGRRTASAIIAVGAPLLVAGIATTSAEAKEKPMTDIEKRLFNLEARAAIEELRNTYAWCAMRGDAAGVAGTFTEDCTFDGPAGPGKRTVIHGRKNLEDFLAPQIGKVGAVLPLIHNHLTEVTGPDTAKGSCVMETPMAPGFGHLVCQYLEDLALVNGKWLFKVRKMYLFLPTREEMPS